MPSIKSAKCSARPFTRAVALMLSALLLLSAFAILPLPTRAEEETGAVYSRKVVSVLYDNSGSMSNADNRQYYALYALRMLASLLGENDRLVVTPMNNSGGGVVTSTSQGTEVDLSLPDRENAMKTLLDKMAAEPSGGTPAAAIDVAAKQLVERGMQPVGPNDEEEGDEKTEYWLVILTDGYFDKQATVESTVKKYSKDYRSFRTIYLTFGNPPDPEDESTYEQYLKTQETLTELQNTTPTTVYSAAPVTNLSGVMQSIANQLSGRYTAKTGNYTVNGNRVTIDLDSFGYAVRSVSILAQNCGAKVTSAQYNGQNIDILRPCVITPTGPIAAESNPTDGLKNGFSGVLQGNPTFSGGKIELVFDKAVNTDGATVAVLVEPALYLTTYMEYQKDGAWYAGDAQYVNSNMQPGQQIRIGYRVKEAGSDKDIPFSEIFGEATSKVTYAGKTYEAGEAFPLVLGTNEISLAVSVMDGAYTMYANTLCVIEENPTYYRLVASHTPNVGGSAARAETVFTPYVNDSPMTQAQLDTYTYTVTLKTVTGQELPVSARTEDGKIIVDSDLTGNSFGVYALNCRIRSKEGISRTCDQEVRYYPSAINLSVEGDTALSMTQYGAGSNTLPFSFRLSAEGAALTFDNPLVRYSLTSGAEDLTAAAVISGDLLTYIPTTDTLGALAGKDGEHTITLKVTLDGTTLSQDAKVKLTLSPTSFVILPLEQEKGTVDRFALGKNQTSSYFRVIRDGVSLSAEELTAAIESGELSFSAPMFKNPLLPAGQEVTVETVDGLPAVRVRVVSDQPGILSFFTSMLIGGKDQTLSAAYGQAAAEDTLGIAPASFMDYFLPLSVIGAIIYTILFFALRPGCRKLQRSLIIKIRKREGDTPKVSEVARINNTFVRRLIPARLIPFIGLRMAQSPVKVEAGTYVFSCGKTVGGKMQMDTGVNIKVFPRSKISSETFLEFLRACQGYAAGSQRSLPRLNCTGAELESTFRCDAFSNNEEADPDFVKAGGHLTTCPEVWAQYDRSGNLRYVYVLVALK